MSLFFGKKEKLYISFKDYDKDCNEVKVINEYELRYELDKKDVKIFELDINKLQEISISLIKNNV